MLFVTLGLALALAAGPGAQSPAPEQQRQEPAEDAPAARPSALTERAQVDLVLIEAVVLDRRGRHVRGLSQSEFRLRVGDHLVPIVSFDEIDLTRRAAGETSTVPPPPATEPQARPAPTTETGVRPGGEAEPASPEASVPGQAGPDTRLNEIVARLQGPRWFVMAFDGYNNLSPLRMSQVRRAAKKWLDANLRERDMVAVYEFNPYLSSISGFTNERGQIKDAIEKVRMFPASSMGREMMSQRLEQADAMPREFLEQQLLNAAQFGGDLLRAERDQFYQNLHALADAVGDLRGTKSILLFSGGFPLTRTRETAARGGFTTRFKEMIRALEQRGIRVFTYDVGVEGFYTDASEDTNFRVDLENLGFGSEWLDTLQIGAQIDMANAHQEILFVLGSETGGRFWRGKDYASGLEAADDDLSHYYLIGYRPLSAEDLPQRKRDYVRMKVEVERGGLRVISRQGNFLPGEMELQRQEELEQLQASWGEAELSPAEPTTAGSDSLELSCRPQFYPSAGGETLVVLPVKVAGQLAAVSIGAGEAALDFDIRVAALAEGRTFQEGSRNVRLAFPSDKRGLLQDGVQIREAMLLPPGVFELLVQFRLNGMNLSGEWRGSFSVPDRGGERFGLTDLALLQPRATMPLVYDVFHKGDQIFGTDPPASLPDPLGTSSGGRPPLDVDGEFPSGVPLVAQTQVTSPPPPRADRQSPLSLDWELVPSAGGPAVAPPAQYRRLQMLDGGGLLDVIVELDLADVAPGDYTLRLTARRVEDDAQDVRSRPITITP